MLSDTHSSTWLVRQYCTVRTSALRVQGFSLFIVTKASTAYFAFWKPPSRAQAVKMVSSPTKSHSTLLYYSKPPLQFGSVSLCLPSPLLLLLLISTKDGLGTLIFTELGPHTTKEEKKHILVSWWCLSFRRETLHVDFSFLLAIGYTTHTMVR